MNTKPATSAEGSGRVAGIDFGTVRIGIAISDPSGSLATPLEVYRRKDVQRDAQYFTSLVAREGITRFVVGLPVHMSGDESGKSREVRRFGSWLELVTQRPVEYFDERYSTAAADELMRSAGMTRKQMAERRDMIAAQQILAAYLESSRRGERPQALEDD